MEEINLEFNNVFNNIIKNKVVKPKEVNKRITERHSIISEFVKEINSERKGTKYKPLSGRYVAIILSPIKTNFDLRVFLSECRDYKNRNNSFSKRFFGKLKK